MMGFNQTVRYEGVRFTNRFGKGRRWTTAVRQRTGSLVGERSDVAFGPSDDDKRETSADYG